MYLLDPAGRKSSGFLGSSSEGIVFGDSGRELAEWLVVLVE
jgi:hypothetical protein